MLGAATLLKYHGRNQSEVSMKESSKLMEVCRAGSTRLQDWRCPMKLNNVIRCVWCCVVLSLGLNGFAQNYSIEWSTVDGGGQTFSTGGGFELGGTIGQPDAQVAPVMTGGSFELAGGFWPGAVPSCACLGDMNVDGEKTGLDIQAFVDCLIAGGSCTCADVDGVSGITIDDTGAFVQDLLDGATCP